MSKPVSPLPWRMDDQHDIWIGNDELVCTLLCDDWREKGEYLISACNSHTALVEALEEVLKAFDYDGWNDRQFDALDQCKAALKGIQQ